MKKISFGLSLCFLSFFLNSCDTGWTDNKKEAVKIVLKDNFKKGLKKNGASISEEKVDGWVDCVSEKIYTKFASFEEFQKNQNSPEISEFMSDCSRDVLE